MGKQITDGQRNAVVFLTSEGYSRPEVSERLGVSESTVSRTLKELVEDTHSRNTIHALVKLAEQGEIPGRRVVAVEWR